MANVSRNQPEPTALPGLSSLGVPIEEPAAKFVEVLEGIGATVVGITRRDELSEAVRKLFPDLQRMVSSIPQLNDMTELIPLHEDPHLLENVDLAILPAHFAVAENGAVWITDGLAGERVLPFICQQLCIVLYKNRILRTMHEAYEEIGTKDYGFGTFISGPSKTADIEQSLVLGAHGPKAMTVILVEEEMPY